MSSNKIEISVKDIPEIIKTLEEAEKEIEFERKSKNLFIDDLYKVCEISLKQGKEIERLNNIIETFEEELERESNMKEEYTCLEHNTFIDIKNTLKSVLKRFQELKGSDKK